MELHMLYTSTFCSVLMIFFFTHFEVSSLLFSLLKRRTFSQSGQVTSQTAAATWQRAVTIMVDEFIVFISLQLVLFNDMHETCAYTGTLDPVSNKIITNMYILGLITVCQGLYVRFSTRAHE